MDIKDLNIEPLERHVSGLIGVQNIKFEKTFGKDRRDNDALHLSSNEMLGFTGIFQSTLSSVKIISFGPIVFNENRNEYQGSISILYEIKTGGTNSIHLCRCHFNIENIEWTFYNNEWIFK